MASALGEEACAIGVGIMILQEFVRIPQVRTKGERAPESVLGGFRLGRSQSSAPAWTDQDGIHGSTIRGRNL